MKKILIITVVILAALAVSGGIYKPSTEPVTVIHTVHTGDTLWEIVQHYKAEYNDKRDIREIIYYTGSDGKLQPGQQVTITLHPEAKE